MDKKVNDEFIKWVDDLYGDDEIGRVKAVRGKKHDYIGMILDYSEPGQVSIDMRYYVQGMLDQFKHESSFGLCLLILNRFSLAGVVILSDNSCLN